MRARSIVCLVALAAALVLVVAGGAGAQQLRDPFNPLVRAETAGGAATTTQPATGSPTATQPGTQLAQTGFEAEPYLVTALTLLCLGGTMLVLARVRAAA